MDLQTPSDRAATTPSSSPRCDIVGTGTAAQATDLAESIENARQEERLALAREMHDDIGGTLTALKLRLVALRNAPRSETVAEDLSEIAALLDSAMAAAERVIRSLRPGLLDQGLVAALEWETNAFAARTGTRSTFTSNRQNIDVPKGQSLTIYRVCQEALNNVAKHAAASSVEVHLFRDHDALTLEVSDNGRGFDTSSLATSSRFGVLGMRERAKAYGGWIEISSTRGSGTTVMLSVPLRRVEDVEP